MVWYDISLPRSPSETQLTLVGINSITYYLTYTLQNYLGFERNLALIIASVAFTQYAIMSFPPYWFIDKIGRRWTIMLSSAGCALCMAIVAGVLIDVENNANAAAAVGKFTNPPSPDMIALKR